jgi:hypothetical protein
MLNMILDDLLFAVIIAGIGLSGAYLRAEYISHVSIGAAERRREAARALRICIQDNRYSIPDEDQS